MQIGIRLRHLLCLLPVLFAAAPDQAQAGKDEVLHSFCETGTRCKDGFLPLAPLVMDSEGNLFGSTADSRTQRATVFELQRQQDGSFTFQKIFLFDRPHHGVIGQQPWRMIVDVQGNLYGTTDHGGSGGSGVVFELSPGAPGALWSEKVLYAFCSQRNCIDGSDTENNLTYEGQSTGSLYDGVSPLFGLTAFGGAKNGGTAYELNQDSGQWTHTIIYNFCANGQSDCPDGRYPSGGLTTDSSGNLYGVTTAGGIDHGTYGAGVAFELSRTGDTWTQTILYRFCQKSECRDGETPIGGLVRDGEGNFFGATQQGGRSCTIFPDGCGTIFKLIPNGETSQESVLYAFCAGADCTGGAVPSGGVTLDSAGNLLGDTLGGGNVSEGFPYGAGVTFQLSGKSYKTLHKFCVAASCPDGAQPGSGLVIGSSGELYGVTAYGGNSTKYPHGGGTVFRITP